MFICSFRASTLKFFGVTTAALAALVTLLVYIPGAEPSVSESTITVGSESVRFDKIKTEDDRISFLRQFDWEVEVPAVEEAEAVIPAEFDKIYQSYNALQKRQGFDLSRFHRKKVMRYTYRITNYSDVMTNLNREGYSGDVYVSILVWKGRVVGGDVCSADTNGFIHGLDPNIEYG